MLTVLWVVLAVLLAALLTSWVAFTATRLDRLHARVDAAQAALDAQLTRRADALKAVTWAGPGLPAGRRDRLVATADAALAAGGGEREHAENAVTRAAGELAAERDALPAAFTPALDELAHSGVRVVMARRFYNDAVRDTRSLRGRRLPRLAHLAGHRGMPQYFDIDDSPRPTATDPDRPDPDRPEPIRRAPLPPEEPT